MSEVFLEVLNTGIMAGWLVLAVLLARLLLKNAPAWAKCALWAIVGLRLLWPFEIESVLSLVPSAQTLPPAALYTDEPEIHTGINYLNSTVNPTFTQTFQPEPSASVNPLQVAVFVAAILWLLGIVAMLGYALVSYLRLRRRVRVSMPVGEGVYLCDNISSPFILGLVKPKIYLPSDLPQEKWEDILSHERAHLARKDHWWKPLGFVLLAVFWFHPLLWLAYVLLCRDVEQACDEKVIKTLSPEEKQNYSQVLLECSVPRKWITACPLAFGEIGVKQRIKAVLHYKKPTLWIIIAALVLCTVLAVCFLTEPVTDQAGIPATMLFDRDFENTALQGEMELDGFRDVFVRWNLEQINTSSEERPVLVKDGKETTIFADYPRPTSLYAADVTGDGKIDLCAEVYYFFSGLPSYNAVCVYDIVAEQYYLLGNGENMFLNQWASYYLRMESGKLVCDKFSARDDSFLATGTLFLADTGENMTLCLEPLNEPVTADDVAGKLYVYEKDGFGGRFTISIYEDGTCQYYVGALSSYIGRGEWELKDSKLYLYDDAETFVFHVRDDALVYIADESNDFGCVDVADGEKFNFYCEIDPPEESDVITAADISGKLYVYEKNSAPFLFIAIEEDGTFSCPDLYLSSVALPETSWELKEGKLYLNYGSKTFVFRVESDALIYLAEESDSFMLGDVADGERFNFYCELDQLNPVTSADLAGKSYTCRYERELDTGTYTDWFTLMLHEDGTCWYHTSGWSSQMHDGTWSLEEGKLYVRYETFIGEGVASFDVKADGTLYLTSPFIILSEGAKFENLQSNLVWVEVETLSNDKLIGLDSDGNRWRVLLTEHMTRRDLEHTSGGVWVSYYGDPLEHEDGTYEVTATACWQFVEDETIREGKELRWIYDYWLYDFDSDDVLEECIISGGWTSGISTVYFSTWENGECETGVLMQVDHALGYAFGTDESGLYIITSEGRLYYPGLYSNGIKH